jgi:hypothetical protein
MNENKLSQIILIELLVARCVTTNLRTIDENRCIDYSYINTFKSNNVNKKERSTKREGDNY